ncbi:MAG: hypothetical protein HY017_00310 [Betaproteobacteria bacterium]|nr:hypothetical protein [Betaproteobacteria bacterium]
MNGQAEHVQRNEAAREASSNSGSDMRALIGLSSQIARKGYGEPVIELALRRKGVAGDVARLVAVSVVSCHAAILAAEGNARLSRQPPSGARRSDGTEQRTAKASRLALAKIMSFLVFVVAGAGGGAILGWDFGFERGVEDGFEWIVRVAQQLISQ